jgi:hypothetical protein
MVEYVQHFADHVIAGGLNLLDAGDVIAADNDRKVR